MSDCDENIQTMDLTALRDLSPIDPTFDIKFSFTNTNTGIKSEIPSHKLILAMGSSLFKAQFYVKDEILSQNFLNIGIFTSASQYNIKSKP